MTRISYAAAAVFARSAIGANASDCRSSGSVPALSTYCRTDPPMGCKAYCSGPHAIAFTVACAGGGARTYEFQEAIEARLILAGQQGIEVCPEADPNTFLTPCKLGIFPEQVQETGCTPPPPGRFS